MNLREYILIFLFGTILAWSAWFVVLFNIAPDTASFFSLVIFYVTLFIGLGGFFTTFSTLIRAIFKKRTETEELVKISLRQGFLFSVLITGTLILLANDLATIFTLLLFIGILSAIEFLFLSTSKQ